MIQSSMAWIEKFQDVLRSTQTRLSGQAVDLDKGLDALGALLETVKNRDGSVWWVGNGGSSAICSHLSQDVLNKLNMRSLSLTDASLLTCIANDFGYEQIYSRPLDVLTKPGDLLVAISSSGKSKNILAAADLALKRNMSLVTLSGFSDRNPLWSMPADISFYTPSVLYGQVEIGHETLLHSVIETAWLNAQNGRNPKAVQRSAIS